MTKKACIQLKNDPNNATRASFTEAIELLTAIFEGGGSNQALSGCKRVCPASAKEKMNRNDDVVWFTLSDNDSIPHFKSLAKLVMERNRVGDKYEIIINPELGGI